MTASIMAVRLWGGGSTGTWQTIFTQTPSANDQVASGTNTLRMIFGTDILSVPSGSPTKIRITVEGHSATSQTWDNFYVDNSDVTNASDPNYNATPVRITWSGSNSLTLGAGSTVLSDEMVFTWNTAKGLAFGADYTTGNGSVRRKSTVTTAKSYYRLGVADSATTGNVSGSYTWWNSATESDVIKKIEVFA